MPPMFALTTTERKALCFAMTYVVESLKRGAKGILDGAESVGVEPETLKALAEKFCGSLEDDSDGQE